jgi:small subunit ribosomal protein S4
MYGVLEKQFRNYYKEASRMQGITGENLLVLLESRLDNVIYRAGFASTRPQARQLVSHRHFKINGRFVDVPSHQIKVGDQIEIKDGSKELIIIQHTIDTGQDREIPSWLDVDVKKKAVKINSLPSRSDASSQIEEQLIVELYSK